MPDAGGQRGRGVGRNGCCGQSCSLFVDRLTDDLIHLEPRQCVVQVRTEDVRENDAEEGYGEQPPTRDIALLTPDATPAFSLPAAFMTVVVRGATVTAMPTPRTQAGGKKVCQ
jgi:hypothetical protein